MVDLVRNGPWFMVPSSITDGGGRAPADAGHGGFPGYDFAVLLIGCFRHRFAVRERVRPLPGDAQQQAPRWMVVLLCVVLVVFTLVKSKIVHDSPLATIRSPTSRP